VIAMLLLWTVFRQDALTEIIIVEGSDASYARIKLKLSGYDGTFLQYQRLPREFAKKVPSDMIGTPLSIKKAEALLKKLG
jgi:hypothetical protein